MMGRQCLPIMFVLAGCPLGYANAEIERIERVGDVLQVAIPALAYGSTFYQDDAVGRRQFYQSFASNVALTHTLKYAIDKKRPNGGRHSFPSGHTSTAFQGASFVHKRYGLNYAIPMYVGASFVGYSRVVANKHDVVDVLAGAGIGMLSSFYFTQKLDDHTHIATNFSSDYYGVNIHYTFD